MTPLTCDLYDAHPTTAQVCETPLRDFGGRVRFHGAIVTVACFEDNSKLKELSLTPGEGRVIVIDPTLLGWRSDSIRLSSVSCRARSSSSAAKAGFCTTSAMIANASAALSDRVVSDTSDASGPALAPIAAPRLSI